MRSSTKADQRPSFQFYPDDWTSEVSLRICPLQDRGLWIEMLCIMWKAPRRGYLEAGGSKLEAEALARAVGSGEAEVKQSLSRMQAAGVYETDETGTIYSRRMVREEKQRRSKVEAGRRGGRASKPRSRSEAKRGSSSPTPTSSPTPLTESEDEIASPDTGVRLAQLLQRLLREAHPSSRPTATAMDAEAMRVVAGRVGEAKADELCRWASVDRHWGPVLLARGGPGVKFRQHLDAIAAKAEASADRLTELEVAQREERKKFSESWRRNAAQSHGEATGEPGSPEVALGAIGDVLSGLGAKTGGEGE